MNAISVIILTFNEKLHIQRCIERASPLTSEIFVVDCHSTDGTQEIARANGAIVVEHDWPGNQALQFNWALENLPIKTNWILRLDADEYLYEDTIKELQDKVIKGELLEDITSFSLVRDRTFMQRRVRFGCPEIELVRLFKFGYGSSEVKEMDEHIVTTSGRNIKLKGRFIDDSLISFDAWKAKHVNYADREARQSFQVDKRSNKQVYYRLPPYFRAFLYFCYRYFFRLGFLDGYAGLQWNFWQALWYRCLVDKKIGEFKRCKKR